jgi:AraC-like DNA-binding protein
MSVRTLQRRLHIAGVTYSTVVDQARFQIASKHLATSARPSKEIAESLGYSDASHFARAFRRLTGLSPQEYRQQCRQEAQQRAGQEARQLE